MESFQDDFRECPQNTNRIIPDNELNCYDATAKIKVESKFIWLWYEHFVPIYIQCFTLDFCQIEVALGTFGTHNTGNKAHWINVAIPEITYLYSEFFIHSSQRKK